jgi:hypothetical protein
MQDETERQQHFPLFWRSAESLLRVHLARLGIEPEDAECIASDIMRRCSNIKAVLPVDPDSQVHRNYGALLCDAVTAEQRLLAARTGRMPGITIGDWPPTPLEFKHPFLLKVQAVVSALEVEVNEVEGRKRLN